MKEGEGNKSKVKTIIVVFILLLVGVLGVLGLSTAKTYLSGAAAGVEPKGVSVVVQARQATITWTSEKASMGVVEYGTSPASLLLRAPETDLITSHSMVLSPLKPGLSYYFRVRVGDEVFDNNGIPYSFKTKDEEAGDGVPQVTVAPNGPTLVPTQATGGSCQFGIDYNEDGVKNAFDVAYCNQNNLGGSGGETSQVDECSTSEDYDANGVVNSFDMIKCLQNRGE